MVAPIQRMDSTMRLSQKSVVVLCDYLVFLCEIAIYNCVTKDYEGYTKSHKDLL